MNIHYRDNNIYTMPMFRRRASGGGGDDKNLLEVITGIYKRPVALVTKLFRQDGTQITFPGYYPNISIRVSNFLKSSTGSQIVAMNITIPYHIIGIMRSQPIRILRSGDTIQMDYSITGYGISVKTVQDVVEEDWYVEENIYNKWKKTGEAAFELSAGYAMESLFQLVVASIQRDVNDIYTTSIVDSGRYIELSPGSNFPSSDVTISIIS